jgi:hypothetical protein
VKYDRLLQRPAKKYKCDNTKKKYITHHCVVFKKIEIYDSVTTTQSSDLATYLATAASPTAATTPTAAISTFGIHKCSADIIHHEWTAAAISISNCFAKHSNDVQQRTNSASKHSDAI